MPLTAFAPANVPPVAVHEVALVELQVRVEVPPLAIVVGVAVSVAVNGRLAVQGPRADGVAMFRPGLTVTENSWVLEAPTVSVAVMLKLKIVGAPTAGAVPLRVAPFSVSQAGRLTTVQVIVPVPPVAAKVWE